MYLYLFLDKNDKLLDFVMRDEELEIRKFGTYVIGDIKYTIDSIDPKLEASYGVVVTRVKITEWESSAEDEF